MVLLGTKPCWIRTIEFEPKILHVELSTSDFQMDLKQKCIDFKSDRNWVFTKRREMYLLLDGFSLIQRYYVQNMSQRKKNVFLGSPKPCTSIDRGNFQVFDQQEPLDRHWLTPGHLLKPHACTITSSHGNIVINKCRSKILI